MSIHDTPLWFRALVLFLREVLSPLGVASILLTIWLVAWSHMSPESPWHSWMFAAGVLLAPLFTVGVLAKLHPPPRRGT